MRLDIVGLASLLAIRLLHVIFMITCFMVASTMGKYYNPKSKFDAHFDVV